MALKHLMDQLLGSAGLAGDGADRGRSDLGKLATGALAGGALGLLVGSRGGRRLGGKLLKVGAVAALGALAWQAYQDHQARSAGSSAAGQPQAAPAGPAALAALPEPEQERHARAMLKAMIAAAKSDGHMDERERDRVEAELHRLEADPALRSWVDAELRRPVEPAEIAAAAASPEMAAEVYLVSALVVDTRSTMERAYLDALAAALSLPPALRADLDRRAELA